MESCSLYSATSLSICIAYCGSIALELVAAYVTLGSCSSVSLVSCGSAAINANGSFIWEGLSRCFGT
jgi:hypothetical protein